MSADRTPAPVAVPEGGWQDGDWFVLTLRDGPVTYRREPNAWRRQPSNVRYDEVSFEQWLSDGIVVYVHAPRPEPVVDGPGFGDYWTSDETPEPVVAPLPTEAVEARRIIVQMLDSIDEGAHALVDRHLAPIVNELSPYGEDRAKFFAVHNAIGVAPSLKSAVAVIRDRLDRLVPEDDEDTVLRQWADWIEGGEAAAGLPVPFTLRTVIDAMRSGRRPFGTFAGDGGPR